MAQAKTLWLAPAVIAAAMAAGAGIDRVAVTTFDTSARVREIQHLSDGQIAVSIDTMTGDCAGERQYVFNADGTNARLNGRPTKDSDALSIGAAALAAVTPKLDPSIADRIERVQFLSDGQIAIWLSAIDSKGKVTHKQMVYAADGSNPRMNGRPTDEKTTNELGPVASQAIGESKQRVAKLVDTLTKPLEPFTPPGPSTTDLGK